MLDAIRQRQIDESLNDIRDFNRMVFDIEKRNVGLNPDNVLPYTQINPEAIEATNVPAQQPLLVLEKKRAEPGELKRPSLKHILRLRHTDAVDLLGS